MVCSAVSYDVRMAVQGLWQPNLGGKIIIRFNLLNAGRNMHTIRTGGRTRLAPGRSIFVGMGPTEARVAADH